MSVRHEGVLESVPENVKNMLLVLATNGVLRPDWRVSMVVLAASARGPRARAVGWCVA